jgi:hypothetical protein
MADRAGKSLAKMRITMASVEPPFARQCGRNDAGMLVQPQEYVGILP